MSREKTSSLQMAQTILATFADCGLQDVVISPGSRSAPLVIAAHHHPATRVTVALDERSAAHIAMGMTLSTGRPVAAITTSGTAAVNHGPALAEAHYAGHPLISLTADRGVESRHQGHGQTVVQPGLFSRHVRASLDLVDDSGAPEEIRAAWSAMTDPANPGPIHVNVPFDEPLYGELGASLARKRELGASFARKRELGASFARKRELRLERELVEAFEDLLGGHAPRVMLVAGADAGLWRAPAGLGLALTERMAVAADVLSGLACDAPNSPELWLAGWEAWPESLVPDVVVTVGQPPMSKRFRNLLADVDFVHVHVGPRPFDVWGRGVLHQPGEPAMILAELAARLATGNAFAAEWEVHRDRTAARLREVAVEWSDWSVFQQIASHAEDLILHLANSTSTRLAQHFNWKVQRIHANRGVAGIDGCTSTAVGDALANPDVPVLLITGDTAWLYDLNGLHVNPLPSNLRVVVIDNGGGQIFRWLPGPSSVGLLEPYFEAAPRANLKATASLVGLAYHGVATNQAELVCAFEALMNDSRPGMLIVRTDGAASAEVYRSLHRP
jgi:2-succinyl-5-enolpyruvyl-6-hydroxy-3-cyclohexene-1-carboxylate synthase